MKSTLPKIIVIVGPTASGKTALSLETAEKFKGEIISADSRQIYRGMDIGTAKPTKTELNEIKHHLIDIKNPNQNYTVAQYKKDAIRAINKVLKKGKLPILVGGTGLYIKAVVQNLTIPEVKPSLRLRKKLEKELKTKGLNYLYKKLIGIDPEAAYIIDRHNPRRVIRALEIIYGTGTLFSKQRESGEKLFNALEIGITLPKEELKKKIEKRVDLMIQAGLLKEVQQLLKKYPAESPVFDAIGYREIINHLEGSDFSKFSKNFRKIENPRFTNHALRVVNREKYSLDKAIELIKKNTWQYAKRQITWFKADKEINWISDPNSGLKLIKDFLQ